MCLILFAYKASKTYPLILAANRDEFYSRPTASMHFWNENMDILAGKDLVQGGTWFGIHKSGRFAALTNYRSPQMVDPHAPSRGEIIIDFLNSGKPVDHYFTDRWHELERYNGFNLLFGSLNQLFWLSNVEKKIEPIEPGIHGLSNKDLNTPWPKVQNGKANLSKAIHKGCNIDILFDLLTDTTRPADDQLPDTGVGLEWERHLSPIFIQSPGYGTRSSTVMLVDHQNRISVMERTFDPERDKNQFEDQTFSFLF